MRGRYIDMTSQVESDYRRTSIAFVLLTNIITISGVLVTALISLSQVIQGNLDDPMFWATWSLSLLLTISSKVLYSYSIDKKYIINFALMERLKSEGWRFLNGVGVYEPLDTDDAFRVFCARVEDLKTKTADNTSLLEFNDTVEIVDDLDERHAVMRSRFTGKAEIHDDLYSDAGSISSTVSSPRVLDV